MTRQWFQDALLQLLKLPPEPPAPFGEEKSLRVFRASPQFLKYQLVVWGMRQAFILVASLILIVALSTGAVSARDSMLGLLLMLLVLVFLATIGIQLAVSFLAVYLQYEMRWYKLTDRSLRIREGIFQVREMTMTFVNIQNVEIEQGPIQRWLGISDLKVETAGGGGAAAQPQPGQQMVFNMHAAYFRGVDNAAEILQLMQERLRRSRSSGLGDPDEALDASRDPGEERPAESGDVMGAASGVLEEARALRLAVTGGYGKHP